MVAKLAEEVHNSNEKTITKKEGKKHTKARLGNSLKKKGQPSNAWPLHKKHRYTAY